MRQSDRGLRLVLLSLQSVFSSLNEKTDCLGIGIVATIADI